MSATTRFALTRTLVVVALVVLAWRVVATLSVRGSAIAATAPSTQLERLTADFDSRIRWSLGDDAEL
ncbi:MAG: hypothetical protein JNL94_15140, partial [Planctomycetes bacterium]|nr:hypothetical protein [Planctomycetota bacterium]